jgi:hypothetical protein
MRSPEFPDSCLRPEQPGYGQVIPTTSGRRKNRRVTAPIQTRDLPSASQPRSALSLASAISSTPTLTLPSAGLSSHTPVAEQNYTLGYHGPGYPHAHGHMQNTMPSQPGTQTSASLHQRSYSHSSSTDTRPASAHGPSSYVPYHPSSYYGTSHEQSPGDFAYGHQATNPSAAPASASSHYSQIPSTNALGFGYHTTEDTTRPQELPYPVSTPYTVHAPSRVGRQERSVSNRSQRYMPYGGHSTSHSLGTGAATESRRTEYSSSGNQGFQFPQHPTRGAHASSSHTAVDTVTGHGTLNAPQERPSTSEGVNQTFNVSSGFDSPSEDLASESWAYSLPPISSLDGPQQHEATGGDRAGEGRDNLSPSFAQENRSPDESSTR